MHFKQQLLIFSCYQWKTRLWKNTFISAIVTIKCPRRMDTERKSEQKQKKDKSGSEERILLDFSHSKWETEFAVRSDCHLVITVPNKEWLLWLCHSTKLLKAASRRQAELGRTWITLSAEHHLYHFITYISYSSDDDSLVPLVILLFLSQGTAFSCFSGNCYTNLKPCIGHRLWRKYRTLWNPPVETNVWKLLNRHSVLFPLSWAVFPQDTHHTVKNIFQRNEWMSTNAVIKIGSFSPFHVVLSQKQSGTIIWNWTYQGNLEGPYVPSLRWNRHFFEKNENKPNDVSASRDNEKEKSWRAYSPIRDNLNVTYRLADGKPFEGNSQTVPPPICIVWKSYTTSLTQRIHSREMCEVICLFYNGVLKCVRCLMNLSYLSYDYNVTTRLV